MTTPNQHGGYRRPRNPAPVSGPGRLARRTDGGPGDSRQRALSLPNPDYGEQSTFRQDQTAAPMHATAGPQGGSPMPAADLSQVVPFGAPTQRPDEPVTAGADAGAGPGSDVLGLARPDAGVQYLRTNLPVLELMANMPSASDAFRQYVRRIRAMV